MNIREVFTPQELNQTLVNQPQIKIQRKQTGNAQQEIKITKEYKTTVTTPNQTIFDMYRK